MARSRLLGRYARCAALADDTSLARVHVLLLAIDDMLLAIDDMLLATLLAIDTASSNGIRLGRPDERVIAVRDRAELGLGRATCAGAATSCQVRSLHRVDVCWHTEGAWTCLVHRTVSDADHHHGLLTLSAGSRRASTRMMAAGGGGIAASPEGRARSRA